MREASAKAGGASARTDRIRSRSLASTRKFVYILLCIIINSILYVRSSRGEPPATALRVRIVKPDEQWRRAIALFEGSKAANPAAALAAWRNGRGGEVKMSKGMQALIACFNPAMIDETRLLDGSELDLGWDGDGLMHWRFMIPKDDGTFSSLATAFALTEGQSEPAIGSIPVDRLRKPDGPLAARGPKGTAVANTRSALVEALDRGGDLADPSRLESGLLVHIKSAALADSRAPIWARRIGAAIAAFGGREFVAEAGFQGEDIRIQVHLIPSNIRSIIAVPREIEPAWLDWIPKEKTIAAVSFGLDSDRGSWDRLFELADRIEKIDPSKAGAAPARLRLNLLITATAGIQPDIDLWPKLKGVSAFVVAGRDTGRVDSGLIALHAADDSAARKRADKLGNRIKRIGEKLIVDQRGSTTLIASDAATLAASLDAFDHPDRSAGNALRKSFPEGARVVRAGAFWAGRTPGLEDETSKEFVDALVETPPILWTGVNDRGAVVDVVIARGLKETIRRFLNKLPLKTPRDGAGG